MIAIMKRLQLLDLLAPTAKDDLIAKDNPTDKDDLTGKDDPTDKRSKRWKLSEQLTKKEEKLFIKLVQNYNEIAFEYSILCTQLIYLYKDNSYNDDDIKQQMVKQQMVITALMMTELLIYLYDCYLIMPKEAARLKEDQKIYRHLLRQQDLSFDLDSSKSSIKENWIDKFIDPTSEIIINHTGTINPFRTFLIRVKRLLEALVPLIKSSPKYNWLIHLIDKHTKSIIGYLSFLFFLPRLCFNIFMLIKHAIQGSWKSGDKRKIDFLTCLNLQFQRRWFEIGNDIVWIIAGITAFLLSSGPFVPVVMAVTVAAYVYDVIATIIRFNQEMSHLENIQTEYRALKGIDMNNTSIEESTNLSQYLECMAQRIDFERRRLLVSVCSTTALTLAIILCLPCVAINPIIPVIGACFLVAITAITYLVVQIIDRQRPPTQVNSILLLEQTKVSDTNTQDTLPKVDLGKWGFFSQQLPEEKTQTNVQTDDYLSPKG